LISDAATPAPCALGGHLQPGVGSGRAAAAMLLDFTMQEPPPFWCMQLAVKWRDSTAV
jgi:hypothetical protein